MIEFFKHNFELLISLGAALTVVSGAAWAIIYYLAYAVRTQALGKTVWCGNVRDNNSVALTFDDGPSPDTSEILEILKAENIKATFFLIGRQVEKHPAIARRIVAQGHEIGNHSYSHPIYLFCRAGKTRRELEKTQEIIGNVTGITPKRARPPCGVRSPAYFAAAKSLNLQTIQWSDAGLDWKDISAQQIAQNVLETIQGNSIVLLHDGDSTGKNNRRPTIEALPIILRKLREKNLRVAPLDELCPQINEEKLIYSITREDQI